MKKFHFWTSVWRQIGLAAMTLAPLFVGLQDSVSASVPAPVVIQTPSRILVEPLLATHWTQWAPYNQSCPVVTNGLAGYGGRAPVGCVPVVLGQTLRYYSWPDAGRGTNSWADTNGVCTGSYTVEWNHPILWRDMKDIYPTGCSDMPELMDPLADLLFKLGVTAKMDYEPNGSGSDVMVLARSLATNLNYTLGELVQSTNKSYAQILQRELSERRPVVMNINTTPSHTVVVDGLAEDGGVQFIHINYGWAGLNDGWYAGFDKPSTNMWFGSIISTFRPNNTASYAACEPNFMELIVTNGIVADQTLSIVASGTNAIQYALTNAQSWMVIDPAVGTANTNKTSHKVSIGAQQLAVGTNTAFIEVSGTATNLPRSIRVQVYKPAPPAIAQDPVGRKTSNPNSVLLEVKAVPGTNYGPCALPDSVVYQWFYNDAPLAAKTNAWCYSSGYGAYFCRVTGAGGAVSSKTAEIKPFAPPPSIVEQPQGSTVVAGGAIVLNVVASGEEPFHYAWYHNGESIPDAVSGMLTISNASLADAGYYQATVANEGGVAESDQVEIIVKQPKGSRIKVLQLSNGKIKFQFENIQSPQLTLQTSTNLTVWTDLQTFQLATPTVQVTMPYPTGDKSRYYRLKE